MQFVYNKTLFSLPKPPNRISKEVFSVLATSLAKCHFEMITFKEEYCLLCVTIANSSWLDWDMFTTGSKLHVPVAFERVLSIHNLRTRLRGLVLLLDKKKV